MGRIGHLGCEGKSVTRAEKLRSIRAHLSYHGVALFCFAFRKHDG